MQLRTERDVPKKEIIILLLLLAVFFIVNYQFLDALLIDFLSDEVSLKSSETCTVTRIVDGDTLVACDKKVRLLGINTPEKKEKYSDEAEAFLQERVLNKTVSLLFGKEKTDRYNRTLAYVLIDNENVNLEIVKNGFANPYFPSGKDYFYDSFTDAWDTCSINLCEKSRHPCADCIKLSVFDHSNERIVLKNICSYDCDLTSWSMKDEGRKSFVFSEFILRAYDDVEIVVADVIGNGLTWIDKNYVFTNSGDTLFLRDNEKGLVLFSRY